MLALDWRQGQLALQLLPFKSKLPNNPGVIIGTDCQADFYPLPYQEAREAGLRSLRKHQDLHGDEPLELLGSHAFLPLNGPFLCFKA